MGKAQRVEPGGIVVQPSARSRNHVRRRDRQEASAQLSAISGVLCKAAGNVLSCFRLQLKRTLTGVLPGLHLGLYPHLGPHQPPQSHPSTPVRVMNRVMADHVSDRGPPTASSPHVPTGSQRGEHDRGGSHRKSPAYCGPRGLQGIRRGRTFRRDRHRRRRLCRVEDGGRLRPAPGAHLSKELDRGGCRVEAELQA